MTIDLGELERISAALTASGVAVRTGGRAVVSRGALNIKNGWRNNAISSAGAHARLYPYTINYDLTSAAGVLEAEIGPDRAKKTQQASYGAILEFGTSRQAGHNDGGRALDEEEPRFIAAVEALADDAAAL